MLILHLYTRFYLLKLSKIKKYMSAGKKDCARSLYNVFVVLSLPERSGRDKFFFLSLCFLEERSEKIKGKNSLRQHPTEH